MGIAVIDINSRISLFHYEHYSPEQQPWKYSQALFKKGSKQEIMDVLLFLKNIYLFIRERERERAQVGGAGAEGEGISSRCCAERRAWCGARSHDPKITTWAETKSQTLSLPCHPGAPIMDVLAHNSLCYGKVVYPRSRTMPTWSKSKGSNVESEPKDDAWAPGSPVNTLRLCSGVSPCLSPRRWYPPFNTLGRPAPSLGKDADHVGPHFWWVLLTTHSPFFLHLLLCRPRIFQIFQWDQSDD